ncbi:MAG: sigma-70 domain-containing protein [Myxococcota bacterium]
MSLDIEAVVSELEGRAAQSGRVDLNDIAEVIGDRAASYEEVESIIAVLEGAGLQVGGAPSPRELQLMREVLGGAHKLRRELKRNPTVDEIAAETGRPVFIVRRALENGQFMDRPRRSQ